MRWIFLIVTIGAFITLFGVGHTYVQVAAFIVMFTNFATFCILYERPMERARDRVEHQLRHMTPNSDEAQRLESAVIMTTEADRHLGVGPQTILNVATGLAGAVLLLWGLVLRVM